MDLVRGDGVVVVRGGQLNRWRRRRGSDGGGGWLVEGLSEAAELRLHLLAHSVNLGQEQLVVERTHGVVVVDFVVLQDLALSTNLLATLLDWLIDNLMSAIRVQDLEGKGGQSRE